MVYLLSFVDVFEEVRLHMLAPSATPLGAVLAHQSEPGIRHDPFDDSRGYVGQFPSKLLPQLCR